jgi:hypothetical protein
MLRDIKFEKVEDVAVAIVPETGMAGEEEWRVYLLNLKTDRLDGVLVSSTGYGEYEGRSVKTSTLRQFFEFIRGNDYVQVEYIDKNLFALNNEFWISFWYHGTIYDKRYVFVTESIIHKNFTQIPMLNRRGVMII